MMALQPFGRLLAAALALQITAQAGLRLKLKPEPVESPLDRYIREAVGSSGPSVRDETAPTGSLWSPAASLTDASRDLRASRVDDIVTVVVSERAAATSKGSVKTSRSSDARGSVSSILGPTKLKGPLADLASASSNQSLDGQGATTRESTLTTTLSARVTHVLPNGYLVVEGSKDTMVNSERQTVIVRGVARPWDVSTGNQVRSDRLAQLEVRINGKGVVNDAVRRPFILYRILLGLLPF